MLCELKPGGALFFCDNSVRSYWYLVDSLRFVSCFRARSPPDSTGGSRILLALLFMRTT